MTDDNGNDRSTPAEPGDTPPEWVPTPEQPWRPLPGDGADIPFVYDYGMLDGPPGVLSVYLVRPFRFGQWVRTVDTDRLALEFAPRDDDGQPFRCSICCQSNLMTVPVRKVPEKWCHPPGFWLGE